MEQERLSKYFTDCGVLSRRAAEEEIKAGRVKVNGETAVIGQKITPGVDTVEYNGKQIVMKTGSHTYVMLNKPRGYITTMSDDKGRQTAVSLCADVGTRVYPVGRLDMESDGLLLLTDDGQLANRLMHPKHEIPKTYEVVVNARLTTEMLTNLGKPHMLDGSMTSPAEIRKVAGDDSVTMIQMTIHEGKNRQIRRICEAHGLKVLQLTRVSVGLVELGNLPVGKWRYLTSKEVAYLKGDGVNV